MTMHTSDLEGMETVRPAGELAFFSDTRHKIYTFGIKRTLDILLVLISLPITLPIIAMGALLVSMDGHSPFYSQMRIGMNGRQ